ncbi:hypothetical protein C0991_009198 [Blastosporella zonata]|nr:hypothetical protein C0991_009198 [Blastosporella zonata]
MSNRVFANYPCVNHSLRDFISHAHSLYQPDVDNSEFIRFVLTGEYDDFDNVVKMAFIDPIQNIVNPDARLTIQRDYDSLLGIADHIMVTGDISVFAIPHPSFALKTSLHFKQTIIREGVRKLVDYHKIPNFELGSFGQRSHLHVFFPGLWSPTRAAGRKPYALSNAERALWYEKGFRPALASLLGQNFAADWPATVETEEFRARRVKGGYSFATKMIPAYVVGDLAETVRGAFNDCTTISNADLEWASSFFILHTIRGVKQTTFHRTDAESASYYLHEFLRNRHLSPNIWREGEWYVDVAIEIRSADGYCLQWMTATHHDVVRQALNISPDHATRITSTTSSKYSRDLASHLTAISGFRIIPGARAEGPFEVKYIQGYTTDKSVLYNRELRHHAKFLTTKEALGHSHPTRSIEGIHAIYKEAARKNFSNARLEVRVPLKFAETVLLEFDPLCLKLSLCQFAVKDWWYVDFIMYSLESSIILFCRGFRLVRLMGISQTLSLQASGRPEFRVTPEALTLTAACVWLLNGLHARPEDGPGARRLMDCALPLAEADDVGPDTVAYRRSVLPTIRRHNRNDGSDCESDEGEGVEEDIPVSDDEEEEEDGRGSVPHIDLGCVMFRRLQVGVDVPRFRFGGNTLPAPSIRYWFDGMNLPELVAKYAKSGIVDHDTVRGRRVTTNKRKPTPRIVPDVPETILFSIERYGEQVIPPTPVDDGSDIEEYREPLPSAENLNEFTSNLWRQFIVDLNLKSPNPRGATTTSYLKLTEAQRHVFNEDFYKSLGLSELFHHVAYRNAPVDDWRRAFDWFFPARSEREFDKKVQYSSTIYFPQWMAYNKGDDSMDVFLTVRKELWQRFRSLEWVPDAQQDKMWPTKVHHGFARWPKRFYLDGKKMPAPRILLKPGRFARVWVEDEEEFDIDTYI